MNRFFLLSIILVMPHCEPSPNAASPARHALDEAKRLASEGQFERALERHVWFHDHALDEQPSLYGVRLSFALGEWVELGKKYPPALVALKEIREKKTARILAGEADRELFHDVESINDRLGDLNATVKLFKMLDDSQPEFAASVYDLADEALVASGEFELARRYLSNPTARLEAAKQDFEDRMEYSTKSTRGDAARRAFERIFSDEVVRTITVLDKTGDRVQAKELQARALSVLDSHAIRNAIRD